MPPGDKIEVDLVHCIEAVLIASESALIEIDPLDPGDTTTNIIIHVNGNHFNLEHHPVFCSGFVRAHLVSQEEYKLKYTHLR